MLDSIRARLTLWYSVVLGLVLLLLAVFTYFLYSRNISQRTDSNLVQLSDAFVTTFQAELSDAAGPDKTKMAAHEAMLEHRFRDTVFLILDSSRNIIASSGEFLQTTNAKDRIDNELYSSAKFQKLAAAASLKPEEVVTLPGGRSGFRTVARPIVSDNGNYTLIALQSLHSQNEMLRDIRRTFYWTIPVGLFLASLGGYFLARKSLAPVAAMASQARGMGAANLHHRLAVANERDELGQLAASFNQLLERLEASFEQQRRFVADASHELRTPVAILRGEAEVTLSKNDRSAAEYRETLAILRDESQRLAHIIEDLFTLTRADAGQYPLSLRDVYLDELAAEVLMRARSLALARKITLTSSIEAELPIRADESLLGRMLLNLLDNAIKYSSPDSTVDLGCRREGEHYLITVTDHGPGVPADLQPRIFERFFRGDKARSRFEGDTGGAGLGLAIGRWIAEAHNGRLELTRSDASGSTFSVLLPAPKQQQQQKPN
jgi:two-component system OmpR family sensor kinase